MAKKNTGPWSSRLPAILMVVMVVMVLLMWNFVASLKPNTVNRELPLEHHEPTVTHHMTAGDTRVDCVVSQWIDVTNCPTCGIGEKKQERQILVPGSVGGARCPDLTRRIPCDTTPCENTVAFVDAQEVTMLGAQDSILDGVGSLSASPKNPVATIHMQNSSHIVLELYPQHAPNTVNNFIYLANYGFWNGTVFHRVIPNFCIQGGWTPGTVPYTIKGEFIANGWNNTLRHSKGVVAMARNKNPNSAKDQFYIALGHQAPGLDKSYATFGKVIQGLNVADRVARQPRGPGDRPKVAQRITHIHVETFGHDYPLPDTLPPGKAVIPPRPGEGSRA
uniref:peptidylprolyl isomerase n=1 Tax=Eutreptiella gymnastica TaxID=73025 RepID=A0A7S1J882_9EUGL|mmetsp:Transcript_75036/g.132579  ORF Transcript_75036/g.132579 Transcript_75036/m.132579 type:complete len:334 (+) Transcript_75036:166-1167(+)